MNSDAKELMDQLIGAGADEAEALAMMRASAYSVATTSISVWCLVAAWAISQIEINAIHEQVLMALFLFVGVIRVLNALNMIRRARAWEVG